MRRKEQSTPNSQLLTPNWLVHDESGDILIHDKRHEAEQQDHAGGVDIALVFRIDAAAGDCLDKPRDDQQKDAAAVQRRNRQEVRRPRRDHAENCRPCG